MTHRRKELGLSSREYEDAIILERIFALAKRYRCSTCLLRKPTHVDVERYSFLCSNCASRYPYTIPIGKEHLPMDVLEKLEAVYERDKNAKANGLSRRKKKSTNRHYIRRSVSSASSVSSAEARKAYAHKKKPSLSSVSAEDLKSRRHKGERRKAHGHKESISSISSFEVPKHTHYSKNTEKMSVPPANPGKYEYDDRPVHQPRRPEALPSSYGHSAPIYGNMEAYPADKTNEYLDSYRPKDPYGYDMPLQRDMPGMMGMVARNKPVAANSQRVASNGWPVMETPQWRDTDPEPVSRNRRYTMPGRMVYPDDSGHPRDIHVPMVRREEPTRNRESRGNPFAASVIAAEIPSNPRPRLNIDDRADRRFDMSSMRAAIQSPGMSSQMKNTRRF